MKKVILSVFAFLSFFSALRARNPRRKKDKDIPTITTSWKRSTKKITRTSWAFKTDPIFTAYNKNYFCEHLLPKDRISMKNNPHSFIDCHILDKQITELLHEIKKQKKQYTKFTILKDSCFNHRQGCGLLILKFKDYPLVLKLFMETPATFLDPHCKGFDNQFFFYMSGGANRHTAGLTRIKNLEVVNSHIADNPRWANKITTPRKWYWLPKRPRYIQVNGWNIGGNQKELSTLLPSVYAIIADELDIKEEAPLLSPQERSELIMELCKDLHFFVDPHGDNFVLKYNAEEDDYNISIVDTEHFPSMVGLQEEPFFNNHFEWYVYLSAKYFQDAFLQTKQDRRQAQCRINPYAIKW